MKAFLWSIIILGLAGLSACGDSNDPLFIGINQQKELGRQFDSTIVASPAEYPILSETEYPEANAYIQGIFNEILKSDAIDHRDEFNWKIRIIDNDSVLNAFATPGGYAYVYTGLIKYLDQEDDLAGVLGHEIAHAAEEHSARNMERAYGAEVLLSILVGENSSELTRIVTNSATGLLSLSYGRGLETEADEKSVAYLADTKYNCAGASSFFEKLEAEGGPRQPQFLSTHPNPGNRVENITQTAAGIGCSTQPLNPASYEDFKRMLP
ncbi:MAG: M48 family metalloprotease [Tunicatimonas sp.]